MSKYIRRASTFVMGDFVVLLKKFKRYTDSPNDDVRATYTSEITDASWSWNRIGGCGEAQIEVASNPSLSVHVDDLFNVNEKIYQGSISPTLDGDLYGGIVEIWVRLFPDLPNVLTDKTATRVYMGRIRRIDTSPKKGTAILACEGLGAALNEITLDQDFTDQSIRQIVNTIVDLGIKGNIASGLDGPLLGKSIIVASNYLDTIVPSVKARGEDAAEILERVISFLPGRYVWGVDRNGIFFLQGQDEPYEERNAQIAVDSYILNHNVVEWNRRIRLDQVATEIEVHGKFNEETNFRIKASAESPRLRQLYGPRRKIVTESDITETSLAGKLAQAELQERSRTIVEGDLTVDEQVHPQKSFRHSTVEFAAPVLLSDTGQVARVMGDVVGNGLYLEGDGGSFFDIAKKSQYQLSSEWLMHIDIRFEAAPQFVGLNMVFGQQNTNIGTDGLHGWGVLYWDSTDGQLYWGYTITAGSINRTRGTQIFVPTGGPFPITVKFTVAVDNTETISFYNGIVLHRRIGMAGFTGSGGIYDHPWRGALSHLGSHGETKLTFNNFSFFNANTWVGNLGDNYSDAFDTWVLANGDEGRLGMAWNTGLIAWAEMVELQDARTSMPVKYGSAAAAADEGLSRPDLTFTKAVSEVGKTRVAGAPVQSPEWYQGKKWGGPLALNHDSVKYRVNPQTGRVRKIFSLGSKSLTIPNVVAQTDLKLKQALSILQKTAQDV